MVERAGASDASLLLCSVWLLFGCVPVGKRLLEPSHMFRMPLALKHMCQAAQVGGGTQIGGVASGPGRAGARRRIPVAGCQDNGMRCLNQVAGKTKRCRRPWRICACICNTTQPASAGGALTTKTIAPAASAAQGFVYICLGIQGTDKYER